MQNLLGIFITAQNMKKRFSLLSITFLTVYLLNQSYLYHTEKPLFRQERHNLNRVGLKSVVGISVDYTEMNENVI